jgi:hypothetical protein
VLTLKHPIRGIDRSHSDSEIDQSISDGYVLHQRLMVMGMKHRDMKCDQNRSDPRLIHRHTVDSCPVAQLIWAPAQCCPKAGVITPRSKMGVLGHPYSLSNRAIRMWTPCGMRPLFHPGHTAPIFLSTFCRVATLSATRASISQDSQDPRHARAASKSCWYSLILMVTAVILSLSLR